MVAMNESEIHIMYPVQVSGIVVVNLNMSYRGFPQSFLARVTSLKKTTFTVNM
jgi:hypothetical protein